MRVTKLRGNESGIVAIIVTLILMLVISITVISFALTSQKEGRQSLDRQLNTQAFYAAESGINDALNVVKAKVASQATVTSKSNCGPEGDYNASNIIDSTAKVSYSCLLVDPAPQTLVYNNLLTAHSKVIPLSIPANTYASFAWNTNGYRLGSDITGCATSLPATATFPAVKNGTVNWNCNVSGVVRIDAIDMGPNGSGTFDRNNPGAVETFFAYPVDHDTATVLPAPTDITTISQGSVVEAFCSKALQAPCRLKLKLTTDHLYYFRIKPIYSNIDFRIAAPDNNSNAYQPIYGSQVIIDATGKANDVLRRVQVYAPLVNIVDFPDYAIQTDSSICKVLYVTNNTVNYDVSGSSDTSVAGTGNACDPSQ